MRACPAALLGEWGWPPMRGEPMCGDKCGDRCGELMWGDRWGCRWGDSATPAGM